ncbi:MAG: monovalent cation:proton antiporter-2 (CPA2) family protein [Alphaproteobacteria bacterium]|nr:monovalent cation:proton antiporter-2 (CPA2) family protein [Alphaproteobacteria bacterium]MBU1560309.1 monovalent cation:proton antiporter-2 (CPA2) family protein [Alphaproteobacteria bacterium]MBU2303634.1 monovalent cation:proton antiporter-2 (CPA2) family protein [Alphaproteobacteria bacterium]MBU2366233.1 monovalent cation:proton antiporter-2 (CPA2) family protein [Alphaproteobacteria bacterium]
MENNLLLAIFVLLAASVALVPLAKAAGLGTVLGYLAAGVLIGPYGLGLVSDSELIHQIADFGIVMMLFLIGLDLQPTELWRMRNKVLGLGVTQMLATSTIIALALLATGFAPGVAVIIGMALSMSSTAIAMQSAQQRDITRTDAGRASLAVLLVQDVSVIPILAAVPLLAMSIVALDIEVAEAVEAMANPLDWITPLIIIGAFIAAVVAGRYLVRPLLGFVARTGVREAFTALGLAMVAGAALLAQAQGFSPALGAFIGGVLLADSEYRHEIESNLEPFKGLLLGLFFISVGMSIAFDVLWSEPVRLVALVIGFVGIKIAVLFTLTSIFRMHLADRLLVAILLSQAGEFAFVIFQFAERAGAMTSQDHALLAVAVALSMATTPLLLLAFDRLVAPRIDARKQAKAHDPIDEHRNIVVLGYGRFGQIITRMLRSQGFEMTLIDDDPAQIELVRKFGVKVFYGDASRLGLLHAAGVARADLVVIAVGGHSRILDIARTLRRHFPDVPVASRAIDRGHAHELMALGVEIFERETFLSAVSLGAKVLTQLGIAPIDAMHMAQAFERHDNKLLEESFAVRNDDAAYLGMVRDSMGLLDDAMRGDKPTIPVDITVPKRTE